ncbi:MAG: HesA/MoeB/ThiF family protein [Saprospiraceae bacterium]
MRYQQQILLPEIREKGQELIAASSVLIIGAGGLGNIVASYLAAMGVGSIGICDFDIVNVTNLHRQFRFTQSDVGKKKSEVLCSKLIAQNPEIRIQNFDTEINEHNAESIFRNYNIICDCTDNAATRMLIDQQCNANNIPLVHGAVTDWQGYVSIFHYHKNYKLTDLFEISEYNNQLTCSVIGINPALCGILGSYMVNETLKIVLGMDEVLEGKLLYINALNYKHRILNIKSHSETNYDSSDCSNDKTDTIQRKLW